MSYFNKWIVFDNLQIDDELSYLYLQPLSWFPRILIIKPFLKDEQLVQIVNGLKTCEPLRQLMIHKTQLNKVNLKLLASLLLWNLSEKLTIELDCNDIADDHFKFFIYPLCQEKVNLSKLYIINNPAIYKGNFLQELKIFLIKTNTNNKKTYLQLIKNKEKKSIAIVRINYQWSQEQKEKIIKRANHRINKTLFYSLNLSNIFLNQSIPFRILINDLHTSILEFISEIDISNNRFLSQEDFEQFLISLSTKQQILKANLGSQFEINGFQQTQLIQKQKQFVMNELSLAGYYFSNYAMNTVLITSIVRFCTKISLQQFCSKYYHISNFLLSTDVESQTPPILILTYAQTFQKVSKISQFLQIIQINNDQQLNSFTQAALSFINYIIIGAKKNKLLKDYQYPLKEIDLHLSKVNISSENLHLFFMQYLFTKQNSLIKIKKFNLFRFGNDNQQELQILKDAFILVFKSLDYLQQPQQKDTCSIENLCLSNSGCKIDLNIFRLFLLNDYIKLNSLFLKQEILTEYSKEYFDETLRFIQIQPSNFIHSLKCLSLIDVQTINFDLYKFLELFIYNPQIRLEKLVLLNLKSQINQESKNQLDQRIQYQQSIKFSLQTLKIGNLQPVESELAIVDYLLFTKYSQLQHLSIDQFHFDEYCYQLQILSEQKENDYFFLQLRVLKIKNMSLKQIDSWNFLTKSIIFHKETKLTQLSFNGLTIDQVYFDVMGSAFALFSQDNINPIIQLQRLKFKNCSLKSDFLFYFIQTCKLRVLQIINCGTIQFKPHFDQTNQLFKQISCSHCFQLEKFQLKDCKIQNIAFFQWLLQNFLFNKNRQKLQEISLSKVFLTNKHLEIFNQFMIDISQTKNRLKKIDLSYNNSIGVQHWQDFFMNILKIFGKEFDQKYKIGFIFLNRMRFGQIEAISPQFYEKINVLNAMKENGFLVKTHFQENLLNKVLNNFYEFYPRYYSNIRNLTVSLKFKHFEQQSKLLCYFQIIHGFIINPFCDLQILKLVDVNLDFFMLCLSKAEKFTYSLLVNYQFSDYNYQNNLRIFQIHVSQSSEKTVKEFVSYFICTEDINLEKLYLSGFSNTRIINSILIQINQRTFQYTLKKINFYDVLETLDEEDTIKFVEIFIFSEFLQLKAIQINEKIKFTELRAEKFKNYNNIQITLEKFIATISNDELQKANYTNLISVIFSKQSKLKKVKLTFQNNVINEILDEVQIENQELSLEKIILDSKLILNDFSIKLIEKSINYLKYFSVTELIVENQVISENFFESFLHQQEQTTNRQIYIQKLINLKNEQDGQYLMDKLILNPLIGFQTISLGDCSFYLNQISQSNFKFIKSLSFIFGSRVQIFNKQNVSIIAEKFLYNEESFCEQLQFSHYFQITQEGLQTLEQYAEEFRKKIKQIKNEENVNLKLCSFKIDHPHSSTNYMPAIIKNILYFEYFSMEEITLQKLNFDDENCYDLVGKAEDWIQFQKNNKRKYSKFYPLKVLTLIGNELFQDEKAWEQLLQTLILTNRAPLLKNLDLSSMALSNRTVQIICKCAQNFFKQQTKNQNYMFPITILKFSHNRDLSELSWKNLFENLFFHPLVKLDELYLIETNIYLQKYTANFQQIFLNKLEQEKTKQLPLKIYLNQNNKFKNLISQYIQFWPQNDDSLTRFSGFSNLSYKALNYEVFEIQNEIIQLQQEYIQRYTEAWIVPEDFKISAFQLNFISNYIQILNNFYEIKEKQIEVCLSLKVLLELCNHFTYNVKQAYLAPYPYGLLLNEELFKMSNSSRSRIGKISIIERIQDFKVSKINNSDILLIWKNISKKNSSIDQILLKYTLNDDLCYQMIEEGYNERDILLLVQMMPPFNIVLKKGLCTPALLGLYEILNYSPYFDLQDLNITSDQHLFINMGISYAIREQISFNYSLNIFVRFFQQILYSFFNFFVSSQTFNEYFIQDKLESELQQISSIRSFEEIAFCCIGCHNILFWIVCFLVPLLYFCSETQDVYFDQTEKCIYQVNKNSNYIYLGFAIFSLFLEIWLMGVFQTNVYKPKYSGTLNEIKQLLEKKTNQVHPDNPTNQACTSNRLDDQNQDNQSQFRNIQANDQGLKSNQNNSNNSEQNNHQNLKEVEQVILETDSKNIEIPTGFKNGDESNAHVQKDPDLQYLLKSQKNQQVELKENTIFQHEQKVSNSKKNSLFDLNLLSFGEKSYKYKGWEIEKKKNFSFFKWSLRWLNSKVDRIETQFVRYFSQKWCWNLLFSVSTGLYLIGSSQAYKFNLYNDMQFILVTYACGETYIYIFALLTTTITQLINIMQFINLIFRQCKGSQSKELPLTSIADVYSLAHIGRKQLLCSLINHKSYFNVSIFPNNMITRYLFPNWAGRGISYQVSNYFFSFFFEDVPQLILQTYFVVKQSEYVRDQPIQIIWTYSITILNLFVSFKTFMSISPCKFQNMHWKNLMHKLRDQQETQQQKQLEREKQQLQFFLEFNPQNVRAQNIQMQD